MEWLSIRLNATLQINRKTFKRVYSIKTSHSLFKTSSNFTYRVSRTDINFYSKLEFASSLVLLFILCYFVSPKLLFQVMSATIRHFLLALLAGTGFLAFYPTTPVAVPPGAIEPYLNGAFTPTPPGNGLDFTLEDPLPGQTFYGPIRIIPFAGTEDILLLGKRGEVWRINIEDQAAEKVLDFQDRSFNLGDGGAVGIVLHPRFAASDATADEKVMFIYYRYKPNPREWSEMGYNRLSKFHWDENSQSFDPDSEEILIQQFDRSTWHNGGDLFFGKDSLLYFSVGDEGHEEFIEDSNQKLDAGLFNGVFRIDIDNDPSRSHPIRRQPLPNAAPPEGWPESFSQGYSIPNDNPWLSEEGEYLEEFYALGTRSPYTMRYDTVANRIWVADVGAADIEEISTVEKGDNLQWPYLEGTRRNIDHPAGGLIGVEKPPVLAYGRDVGRSITGGEVYRGGKFTDLYEKYLFTDFHSNRLMAIDANAQPGDPETQIETLIGDMRSEAVAIPSGAGTTGIYPQANGDILITMIGSRMETIPGKIFRLRQIGATPDPADRLSELGVFTDLENLTTAPGILPYKPNAQLWSDRALKKRWLALPNDGTFDSPAEQINFEATGMWEFPEGTVLIKHFELPLTTDPDGPSRRLETRFFIVGPGRSYGLSYHWNEAGTDAFLARGPVTLDLDITDANTGALAYTQTWEFPGRAQCITCHTAESGFVLGLQTHQLNGAISYPEVGNTPINQLTYLSSLNAFNQDIPAVESLPKAYPIDDESAGLEVRVRSYLDANCASCHRPGGVPTLGMDLRFNTPLPSTNIINVQALSHNSGSGRMIVLPGSHQDSELWLRDAALDGSKMPPLAKTLLDEPYMDVLAEWIDRLDDEAGVNTENLFYPNPFANVLSIRLKDEWVGPFELELYNISGQRLYSTSLTEHNHQIEMGLLPPGIYIVKVKGNGEEVTRKVVKN